MLLWGPTPIPREAEVEPAMVVVPAAAGPVPGVSPGDRARFGGALAPGLGSRASPPRPGSFTPCFPLGLLWGWGHWPCLSCSPYTRGGTSTLGPRGHLWVSPV